MIPSTSSHSWEEYADAIARPIWLMDRMGHLYFFNRCWYDVTGAGRDLPLQVMFEDQVHPDDIGPFKGLVSQSLGSGQRLRAELRFLVCDGGYRWHDVEVSPVVKLGDGDADVWVGVANDIHEHKQANIGVKNFLAVLSHELRNPLAPIVNANAILRGEVDQETANWALDTTEKHVNHLIRLVDDLLDVSRIMWGKLVIQKKPCSLSTIVFQAVECAKGDMDKKGHRLTVKWPCESIMLHADEVRMTQVVNNLLQNAAKYTDAGGRIDLFTEIVGGDVVIRVVDTGVGIDEGLLDKVFEFFVQGARGLDRSGGGLGVGLGVVKGVVEEHGGSVVARNRVEGGSEFIVTLPVVVPVRETLLGRQTYRVLIVEDNVDTAKGLSILLDKDGHHVQVAFSGESGLEVAAEFLPDFILLDIGLPGMDGNETCRRLRQADFAENCAILALTGFGKDAEVDGFDDHLVKPVFYEVLSAAMERCSKRRPIGNSSRPG